MSQHAITILSLQCFIVSLSVLLRHFSVLGFDCLPLFVTSLYYLFALRCFHRFIMCLLSHCSVSGFDCLVLCLLRHYVISLKSALFHYLFVASLLCSRLRLSLPLFVTPLFIQAIL